MTSRLSIIIPCYNEEKTIGRLVRRLQRWKRQPEVIVVANGCTDHSVQIVKKTRAKLVEIPEPLGHDVGRAIGLSVAHGDVCVIIDGDMLVSIEELEPFVKAVESGVDIALNRYPLPGSSLYLHPTAIAKRAVNILTDRDDLHASSLTAVPHAVSRRALDILGWKAFAVPPVAQVQAHMAGLKVTAVNLVSVGRRNPNRKRPKGKSLTRLILGDCLEAVAALTEQRGIRGGYAEDHSRRQLMRQVAEEVDALHEREAKTTVWNAAIISVHSAPRKLQRVIQYVARSGVNKVHIVCQNHDKDRSDAQAAANRYLFLDGEAVLAPADLRQFIRAMDRVDLALNDLDDTWKRRRQMDASTVVKRFLNLALDHPDLGTASMADLPHAMHREVVEGIGAQSLMNPALAQVKAILMGFHVAPVHPVNAGPVYRLRRHLQDKKEGKPRERLLFGDHLEAISYLQSKTGVRGSFPDTSRRLEWLELWEQERRLMSSPPLE